MRQERKNSPPANQQEPKRVTKSTVRRHEWAEASRIYFLNLVANAWDKDAMGRIDEILASLSQKVG